MFTKKSEQGEFYSASNKLEWDMLLKISHDMRECIERNKFLSEYLVREKNSSSIADGYENWKTFLIVSAPNWRTTKEAF